MNRSPATLAVGTTVSHYRIIEKVGAGGMGEVFLADDSKLKRRVALKFLPKHLAQDAGVRARFIREAQAAAGLDHPNIITIHEVSEFEGRPFFAMQYVDGKTLHHYCHKEPLDLPQIITIVAQIAEGLARAHTMGIVHRDIKSVNIVVDNEMRPIILDFGLVAVSSGETLTKVGSTLGTLSYMSPEQAQGQKLDHRSDLFSLGVVLYELVAGQSPFQQEHDAATLYTILHEEPAPIARDGLEIPAGLQDIVTKSLAKDPDNRFQSATDLALELRAVYSSIVSGTSDSSATESEERPSIAVLPFSNMSADPENEFFSDGLTEELLNVLAKIPELKVTGRTSSFAFKGKQEDLRGIGLKLGVKSLLEGSVRKAGNRVRITAQLVSASDGFHLWSETYDRVIDDIFAVQDEIAAAVAKEMHVTLIGGNKETRAVNAEGYQIVLRAKEHTRKMTLEDALAAEKLYQRAAELDPDNAEAWLGLGNSNLFYGAFGGDEGMQDTYRKAKKFTLKSLDMDKTLVDAYYTLSWIRAAFERQFEEAISTVRKGLELAPNNSRLIGSMGLMKAFMGDFAGAETWFARSIDLDPLNPETSMNKGKFYFWSGNYPAARESLLRALELSPKMPSVYLNIAWSYLLEGNPQVALQEIMKEESDGYRSCGLAMIYHDLGDSAKADTALDTLLNVSDQWGFQIASAFAYRNDPDKAFDWIEKSIIGNDPGVSLIKVSPLLKNLHNDPRWPKLLKRIGFS